MKLFSILFLLLLMARTSQVWATKKPKASLRVHFESDEAKDDMMSKKRLRNNKSTTSLHRLDSHMSNLQERNQTYEPSNSKSSKSAKQQAKTVLSKKTTTPEDRRLFFQELFPAATPRLILPEKMLLKHPNHDRKVDTGNFVLFDEGKSARYTYTGPNKKTYTITVSAKENVDLIFYDNEVTVEEKGSGRPKKLQEGLYDRPSEYIQSFTFHPLTELEHPTQAASLWLHYPEDSKLEWETKEIFKINGKVEIPDDKDNEQKVTLKLTPETENSTSGPQEQRINSGENYEFDITGIEKYSIEVRVDGYTCEINQQEEFLFTSDTLHAIINFKCIHNCTICLDIMKSDNLVELQCNHKFHPICIGDHMELANQYCPLCNKKINFDKKNSYILYSKIIGFLLEEPIKKAKEKLILTNKQETKIEK